jgi:hypothetical protein
LHTCVHSICTILTLPCLSTSPPLSHWFQPSQAGPVLSSYSPVLWKKQKWHISLFKRATQEVSMYLCIIMQIS